MTKTLEFDEDTYGNLKHTTKKGTELSVRTDSMGYWYYKMDTLSDIKWKEENPFVPSTNYPPENFLRDTYRSRREAANSLMELLDILYPVHIWDWIIRTEEESYETQEGI